MLISFDRVLEYCPNITGIIHVGAHRAEERKDYKNIPTKWVEAHPELFLKLPVENKYHFAATDFQGWIRFNICPFTAASSLLEPNLNANRRKDVYVEEVVIVPAGKISSIQEIGYNLINLDIQGAELNALKGTDLSMVDYIYTEVHRVETYHKCTQVEELDDYLEDFKRVETAWTKYGWGDAIYIRESLLLPK